MQNSEMLSKPPQFKYNNIWAIAVAILLTLIPIGLDFYSATKGLDAKQQERIKTANDLINKLQIRLKQVDEQSIQCNQDVKEISQILGTTNVMGVSTGEAIRKIDPLHPITPTPTKSEFDVRGKWAPTATPTPRIEGYIYKGLQ